MNENHYGPGTPKGGQFAPKDASEQEAPAQEEGKAPAPAAPKAKPATRGEALEELKKDPEAYQKERNGFLEAFNEFKREVWYSKELNNHEKMEALMEISDRFHSVMEWGDLTNDMKNHFIDEEFSTPVFEELLLPHALEMFPDEGLNGEWMAEKDINRDMMGSDYVFAREDGSDCIVDLKTNSKSMLSPKPVNENSFTLKLGNDTKDAYRLSAFASSGCLTSKYVFMKLQNNPNLTERKLFEMIYREGIEPSAIVKEMFGGGAGALAMDRGRLVSALCRKLKCEPSGFEQAMLMMQMSMSAIADGAVDEAIKPFSKEIEGSNGIKYYVSFRPNHSGTGSEVGTVSVSRKLLIGDFGEAATIRMDKKVYGDMEDRYGNKIRASHSNMYRCSLNMEGNMDIDGEPLFELHRFKYDE